MRSLPVMVSVLALLGCGEPADDRTGGEGGTGSTSATTIIGGGDTGEGSGGEASCIAWPPPTLPGRFVSVVGGGLARFATRPRISADGRYVLFTSLTNTSDPALSIFLHDAACDDTRALELDGLTATELATGLEDIELSADASTVVLTLRGPQAGQQGLYAYDVAAGALARLDVGLGGVPVVGTSHSPSVSADGRFVAFVSSAVLSEDEPPGDAIEDVFVRDRVQGVTTLVGLSSEGAKADGSCTAPSISGDGRLVAFESRARNLALTASGGGTHVYVRDLEAGALELGSPQPARLPPGSSSGRRPSLSSDGRFLAFATDFAHLPADADAAPDVYLLDLDTGALTLQLDSAPLDPAGFDAPRLSAEATLTLAIATTRTGGRPSLPVLFERRSGGAVVIDAFDPAALSLGELSNLRISDDGRWLVTTLTSSEDPQVPQTAGSAVWMLPVATLLP